MATESIIEFGKRNRGLFSGPILEIGSRIDPSYKQFSPRAIHDGSAIEYLGIDIFEGEGVDRTINLCHDNQVPTEWRQGGGYFNTIHCHCVLEHVPDIFSIARNMNKIVKIGGVVFISVPFVWRMHRIPVDMWRFTPQSIDYLFPEFEFMIDHCGLSTRKNDSYPIDSVLEFSLSKKNVINPLTLFLLKTIRRLRLDKGFFSYRALMPEINLMMIGIKRDKPTYTFVDPLLLK